MLMTFGINTLLIAFGIGVATGMATTIAGLLMLNGDDSKGCLGFLRFVITIAVILVVLTWLRLAWGR